VIGRQISHFYIIRTLGAGGMGVVYEAQDTRLPRSVAIKVLKDDLARDVDALRRFKREARLAASLNHPNICTILDVSEDEAQPFIAMELLEGSSLKSRLLSGPLPLRDIVDLARQVCDALGAAHAQAVIHRDITPANIFLTAGGLVKLLDFGLAKHFPAADTDGQATDDLTTRGAVAGTIHYMSPEQLAGDAIDHRCDFFALGAVLYHAATGARPFDLPPRSALSAAIQFQPHVPIRHLSPELPVALEVIIDTLLAKNAARRYQSSGTLRADLDALASTFEAAAPLAAVPPVAMRAAGQSIAVLPIDVVGIADTDIRALADGLTADLAGRLSQIHGLRVAPRTSTQALVGQTARQIAARLGVSMLLEGTVQRSGALVRARATLVDAAREAPLLPAMSVDLPHGEPLATQAGFAREISGPIAAFVSQLSAATQSQEPEANHAFKRGQHSWKSCFAGGWRPAIEHFQHAIALDPHFARAHIAVASAYNFLGFYSLVKPNLAFAVAANAADRALSVDPDLGAAWIEVALARFGGEWDWDGAEAAFRRGLALDPANPLAHVHYSWLLVLLGRDAAAYAEARRGHDLAPSSRLVAGARAQTMYNGGRYDDAIALCNDCLRGDPTYVFALHLRGLCHLVKSMRDAAVADLERAAQLGNRAPFYLGLLGRCYGEFGMRREALDLITELEQLSPDTYVPPQSYVFIYAGLGERERALEYQEKAYEDGAAPFNYLTPCIRELYALSPHHKRRLEQMRLIV